MEVGAGFEVNVNGQVGFAGTDVELGTTVATNLGYSYGVSESIAKSITVSAAAGKDMEHIINIEEIWATGVSTVKVGSKEESIPFSFRKDFRLTLVGSQVVQDCKPEGQSPLEKLAGSYVLQSWTKAIRPIELEGKIVEGSLTIDSLGIADWKVLCEQAFTNNPGRVEMTARGQIDIDTMQIQGVQGGEYNEDNYLDNKWGQMSTEMSLAVRGWDYVDPNDPFRITIDEQSGGKLILQMKNSFGTYVWVKTNS